MSKLPSTCPEEQFVAWFFFKFWIVSDFLQKPLAWFSKFHLWVQIKNCGKNSFFRFVFRIFSTFERKFFRLLAKSSKSCENYLLRVQRNNLWLEIIFRSFDSFWIFCRNLWHGSQISIYVSRVKIAGETVFWFFFSEFFRLLSEIFFRLSAKNLQKVVKTTFCVSTGITCGFKFFKKFWTNLDSLQKLLAWFSKFYLRVQSKNCVRNSFLIFVFRIFSTFERKFFRLLAKSSKSCENYLLRVQRNNLWLEIIFRSFDSFWIFCRNLWHGSQISIYVSRVKIAEETVFWFFFSEFFRLLSEIFFRLSAKNLQKVVKTTFCVSTGITCGFKFFKKFWTNLDSLQKLLAWFSKFYLRVQSKNCVRNSFLIFVFRSFSDFERKNFPTFGRKTSTLCQNYLLRVQRNNLWLEFFLSFESFPIFCRNHWHGSQNSIYESRLKIAEKTVFFRFLFRIFFDFWAKIFQTFGQIFKKLWKLPSACPEEQFVAWNIF